MSDSNAFRVVGDAVFTRPGRKGGNVHVRPRAAAPGTTCGRFIRAGWTNLPEQTQAEVCKWCLMVCRSDEQYGFKRVVEEAARVG